MQKDYVRHVRTFAAFLGRIRGLRPRARIFADINCIWPSSRSRPGSINAAIAALRFFFYRDARNGPTLVRPLTIVNKPRKVAGRC